MLKKHRNALLEIIREMNISPELFKASKDEIDDYPAFRLEFLQNSLIYFTTWRTIHNEKYDFYFKYSIYSRAAPKPVITERVRSSFTSWVDFEDLKAVFRNWLGSDSIEMYLEDKAEEEEERMLPDLWAETSKQSAISDSKVLQNTPFSLKEQERIADALNEFEKKVLQQKILTQEQAELLHEQVEYLVESSKRLGRKDWLMATAGALMGFTLQVGLTSEVATQIIRMAGSALQWIAHTPLLLP